MNPHIRVVKHKFNLAESFLGKLLAPVEDHIFHMGAAQVFGTLLAEYPADGVGNIALAAAVGSYDAGDPVFDDKLFSFVERLQPVQLDPL
ncbi:hypothetical protein SDC9_158999 [bioreactor metagenome]|uniref:Uncharacterized protein n=1 Tax=bioreactor metagenome TaxID=1076179 RepID=A0A645FE15_9ZZZZ